MTINTWLYQGSPFTDIINSEFSDHIGFVYIITNLLDHRQYIGKKTLYSTKRVLRTVVLKNGTKKRKKILKKDESDWKDYWSSSNELKEDIERLGQSNFRREILKFCKTKAEMSYYETKYQLELDVLINPNEWYNGFASCRINRNHLKHLFL
jgi:hypothetical protein